MKIKSIIGGAALALAFVASARADVTVTITGATAFRTATLDSIKARYLAAGTPLFKFAHDASAGAFNGATRAIFIGNFPGVQGTTTIKCCFTGSVEGVRALVPVVDPLPPTYYANSLLDLTTATAVGAELASQGTNTAAALGGISDIAFSDVKKASTPYASYSLLPAAPQAGVIVFTMIGNKGCPISNITAQQFRALLTNGYQPLSLFTGNSSDTKNIYVTGRNDGSGTRTTYLAESGFGISNAVNQYVSINSTSTVLNTIQKVPAGGVNSPALPGQSASNASTVWGLDQDGNGGYNSGATLRGDMAKTSTATTVLDADGTTELETAANINLITWLSLSDAKTARDANSNSGAIILGYNGVKLTDFAVAGSGSTLSAADKAKITEGLYTAWGYENMYRANGITTGDKVIVYNALKNNLVLGTAGIATVDMHVSRSVDGGTVAP